MVVLAVHAVGEAPVLEVVDGGVGIFAGWPDVAETFVDAPHILPYGDYLVVVGGVSPPACV